MRATVYEALSYYSTWQPLEMGEREAEGGDSVVASSGIKHVVVKHRDFNHVRGAGEQHRHGEQLVEVRAATLDDPRPELRQMRQYLYFCTSKCVSIRTLVLLSVPDPRALRKADGNVCVNPRRKPLFSRY